MVGIIDDSEIDIRHVVTIEASAPKPETIIEVTADSVSHLPFLAISEARIHIFLAWHPIQQDAEVPFGRGVHDERLA
jgi:hypothetical protein